MNTTPREALRTPRLTAWLTPPQVAWLLRVKADKVLAWIRVGKLRAVNVGDGRLRPRFRVDPADLQDFLEARRIQPPPRRGRRPEAVRDYAMVYPET